MTIDQTVLELAALKALGDHIKALTERGKAKLEAQLRRGTISAFVEDGEESLDVGTVVVVPTRFDWGVVDERAFLEWVRKNRPDAIVESVRTSDKTSILTGIEKSGEVPDGVGRVRSSGYVSVKQTPKQRDQLVTAAGDGRLPTMPLLELGS